MKFGDTREIRNIVYLLFTLFILFATPQIVSSSPFFCLTNYASTSVSSPLVTLQNVTNSFIYTNYTSAKVTVQNGTSNLNVLQIFNQTNDYWSLQLIKYDDNNISRLTNCTIWFHNGNTSVQIKILDGIYNQTSGEFYNFPTDMDTYITITATTNSSGTSYVYTYLKILKPNMLTYFLYITTFEIT
jgi:hypothetical protein